MITVPISKNGTIPLSHLIEITKNFSKDLYLISGDEGYNTNKNSKDIITYNISSNVDNKFSSIFQYIKIQCQISYFIIKLRKKVDINIFFFGGESLWLPLIISRLLRKKSIVILTGNPTKHSGQNEIIINLRKLINRFVFFISNEIVVYTENIIKERNLEEYENKIKIAHQHFLNFNNFKNSNPFKERKNNIGFIGELRELKGIMNLVEAMPQIIDEKKDVQLLIIGKGKLDNKIHKFIEDNSLKNNIKMIGWVDNYKLPDYLNNLKLLILPSYSEGLPGVIVESMACGTPVLTTNVGSIPDIIENHKNGFILDDNNSKCISKSVLGILKSDEINKISENAQKTANKKFSYNNALNLWKKVYCENDG